MKCLFSMFCKNCAVLLIVFLMCLVNNIQSFDEDDYRNYEDDYINNEVDLQRNSTNRESRWFPFFSIIKFANTACAGPSSFDGTCFTRRECNDIGGSYSGSCANRRGVCCIVTMPCGNTTNVNNTYFTNTGFPATFSGGRRCSIFVRRCNSGVCQLRIDLLEFSLAQPDGDGNCISDALTITGGTPVPRICGENSGQHLYVNFNGNDLITISIDASAAVAFNRRWNIKLTQIACNCPTLAPSGCLMYYTTATGTVNSFNFGNAANTALSNAGLTGTREMVNLNYGVCIRAEQGSCGITWTPNGDFSFTMTGDVVGNGVVNNVCNTDYIIIPSSTSVNLNLDRFCLLNSFVSETSTLQPFVLYVVTNANEGADVANRGFSLNFNQQPCVP